MTPKQARRKITRTERRVSKELGGRRTFASGARDEKSDGVVAQRRTRVGGKLVDTLPYPLRIELKSTSKDHFSLTQTVWEKIRTEAILCGQFPVVHASVTHLGTVREFAIVELTLARDLFGKAVDLPEPATCIKSARVAVGTQQYTRLRILGTLLKQHDLIQAPYAAFMGAINKANGIK